MESENKSSLWDFCMKEAVNVRLCWGPMLKDDGQGTLLKTRSSEEAATLGADAE